jgi:hypothetical protein
VFCDVKLNVYPVASSLPKKSFSNKEPKNVEGHSRLSFHVSTAHFEHFNSLFEPSMSEFLYDEIQKLGS